LSFTSRGEVVQFRIPGDTKYVPMVRRAVRAIAHSVDLPDDLIADIEVSVSEAIANAIEHGSPEQAENVVVVTCRVDPEELTVDVRDEGPGFDPQPRNPDVLQERGRGLKLIYFLMDSVEVSRTRTGAILHMVKKVGAAEREVTCI
jgi:anti-sigma regulatory factor (Ser/Thr protein kinase)